MTVAQLLEEMDSAEFARWKVLEKVRADERYEAEHGPRPLGRKEAMARRAAKARGEEA